MRRSAAALLAVVAASVAPGRASADEKEWILAVEPAFAVATVGDATGYGGGGALDLSYGLTDALAVRATGALTAHSLDAVVDARTKQVTQAGGTLLAYHAGVGLTYTIDIVRLVPYFDFSIGLLGMKKPSGEVSNDLGVEVGIGVDYLFSRRLAFGVVVRYHASLTAFSSIPVYLYAGPRIALHFGG